MRFCGKMHHGMDRAPERLCWFKIFVTLEERVRSTEKGLNESCVAHIPLNKEVASSSLYLFNIAQVFKIPRVGELVKVDHPPGGAFLQNESHKIGADKTGSPCYQNNHANSLDEGAVRVLFVPNLIYCLFAPLPRIKSICAINNPSGLLPYVSIGVNDSLRNYHDTRVLLASQNGLSGPISWGGSAVIPENNLKSGRT